MIVSAFIAALQGDDNYWKEFSYERCCTTKKGKLEDTLAGNEKIMKGTDPRYVDIEKWIRTNLKLRTYKVSVKQNLTIRESKFHELQESWVTCVVVYKTKQSKTTQSQIRLEKHMT